MKYIKTFEQFINEKFNSVVEKKAFIEVSVRDASQALDHLRDVHRGQYTTDGSTYYIFKKEEDAYDALQHLRDMDIEILDTDVNESINSKTRAKIVVALKKAGFINTEDYTFSGGQFLANDLEVARKMSDALSGKYKVAVYDDKVTKDGEVPVMITESLN